jgi:cobalt-zinc-cadmium efflux system membrane fusion protein
MNESRLRIQVGLVALLTVAGMTMVSGCGKGDRAVPCGAETSCNDSSTAHSGQTDETHGPGDGHGHGSETDAPVSVSLDERAEAPCEHSVPIYQCDECRYEAGVVKVGAGILKQGDGQGLVRTQSVTKTTVAVALPATGEVALNENATAHISPRIGGIIDTVGADVGMRVEAGDTLLTLTSVELGRALADYERNRALAALSDKVLKREAKLREQNIGSEQDMIEAQIAFEQHRAELKASEQMLHVLGLTEEDLRAMEEPAHGVGTGRLQVRAPFAGTIIEKHAVIGELSEPGRDVLLLSDLSVVWVWANVYSRDLAELLAAEKRGPVDIGIAVAAFPDRLFKGRLDYIGATMSEETRTVRVRATVENPELILRPGMFCEVSITIGNGQAEEVLVVPRTALFTDEGRTFVFKHWKDDYFARQDVRSGREFSGIVEILSGLQPGDVIASEGGFLLKSDVLREKMGAGCAD